MKTVTLRCPKCKKDKFELRLLRDEAVAAARCVTCSAQYLLLDSKDYWFDVIQKGYPRLIRCSCKNESFRLRINYNIRDDGEVDYIEMHSICSVCGKTRRQLNFEVDYGGTGHLLKKPLFPCKNPKVLYDLKNISLLLTLPDVFRMVDQLAEDNCEFLSRVRRGGERTSIRQNATEVKATIRKGKYSFIYAMQSRIEVTEGQVSTSKKENAFWKRSEVIRIGSMLHVCKHQFGDNPPSIRYCSDPPDDDSDTEVGLLLDIDFSTEFVRGEKIILKSEAFRNVTASLLSRLESDFVGWRGPNCFDNPQVNVRAFGDRFRKKAKVNRKR